MRILDALWRDLRHASRQLLANRGFASAAVVSLALGIGALVLLRAIEGRDGRMARGGENNGFVDPESGRNSTTSFSLLTFERIAWPSLDASIRPAASVGRQNDSGRSPLAERVRRLTRDSRWQLVRSVPIKFKTYHPQGMVKIGETLFVSSVEVKTPTKRLSAPDGRYDRDPGEGTGHLFKLDMAGNLLADLTLGEETMYHPGGIDYDGVDIWVPVAEYRPDSRSIVYRVDPNTMKATEVLRFADHLGAIVHDTVDRSLHAVSWGSRRFYRWPLAGDGRVTGAEPRRSLNTSHYLDYQDCKYVGRRQMLCTGVTEMRREREAAPFRLGGIDLVSLEDGRPLHQVPVPLWTASGLDMTHNPVWIEPTASGLRGYFMPEDDESTLYIYEVGTGDP